MLIPFGPTYLYYVADGNLLSAPHEIDEYELVDPVDILTSLEKSGFWDGVVSAVHNVFCTFFVF